METSLAGTVSQATVFQLLLWLAVVPGAGCTSALPDGLPAPGGTDLAPSGDGAGACTAPITQPCSPVQHQTQGYQASLQVQRYRIVGASPDGRRLAILFSHFGPSSGDPFVNIRGYEEGSLTALFHVGRVGFGTGPGEAGLTELEGHTLGEAAPELARYGISRLEQPPAAEPWCRQGDAVAIGCLGRVFTWSTEARPCPEGGPETSLLSRLCPTDGGPCVQQTQDKDWDCGMGELGLVDAFQIGRTLWLISERDRKVFDTFFRTRMAGGRAYPR
jgi:hypothetical protein